MVQSHGKTSFYAELFPEKLSSEHKNPGSLVGKLYTLKMDIFFRKTINLILVFTISVKRKGNLYIGIYSTSFFRCEYVEEMDVAIGRDFPSFFKNFTPFTILRGVIPMMIIQLFS